MLIRAYDNQTVAISLPDSINPAGLVALPALIDPHAHFRVPGWERKEDWITGGRAAIAGGVTTVFDMPNNSPATTTLELLRAKKKIIDAQLARAGIPLRYGLWLGATADNLDEIRKSKDEIVGIKLFMGASTGNLLVDGKEEQKKIFALAAELGLVVAVHAEDNEIINNKRLTINNPTVRDHSKLRPPEAAARAVAVAINSAKQYGTKLYILHVSTASELELIRGAKQMGLPVFAEATPHHLFLNTDAYAALGAKAQMNPPLRSSDDQTALWAGLLDGTIDCVGTDHAPHTEIEKALPYPQSPSGVPGIETILPLLLNAYHDGKIPLEKIVELTSTNPRRIFNLPRRQAGLPETNDWVIVDLNLKREVNNADLKTKCGWSPFNGWKLTGWPVYTILNNIAYDCNTTASLR